MNSVSDASAAASSTKILSITTSFTQEHRRNIVPFLFFGQEVETSRLRRPCLKDIAWLTALGGSSTASKKHAGEAVTGHSGSFKGPHLFFDVVVHEVRKAAMNPGHIVPVRLHGLLHALEPFLVG